MNNVFNDLFSIKEAAEMWHLEESTIRKAIASKKFIEGNDVRKFGKQWVISKSAMERVYGIITSDDILDEPDEKKAEDIYYFIFECVNAYARKYGISTSLTNKDFRKFNIYEYIYECYDYLHLSSINENIIDIRSRIKRNVKYD